VRGDEGIKYCPPNLVILFGSRARGDAEADSDWDVLVLTGTVDYKIKQKVYSALYKVELDEDVIINVLVIARNDWEYKRYVGHPMKRNVEIEGIMVA
jgi:uncharacterized protein